jgi:hypothetical protein
MIAPMMQMLAKQFEPNYNGAEAVCEAESS